MRGGGQRGAPDLCPAPGRQVGRSFQPEGVIHPRRRLVARPRAHPGGRGRPGGVGAGEVWRLIAYLARYANQPYSELATMPLSRLHRFADAVSELVREENGERPGNPEG